MRALKKERDAFTKVDDIISAGVLNCTTALTLYIPADFVVTLYKHPVSYQGRVFFNSFARSI